MKKGLVIITVIAVISTMAPAAMASDWQQFQHDVMNSGVTGDSGPVNPELAWRKYTQTGNFYGIDTTPIVVGDYVYVIATSKLFKFNKSNGEEVWNVTIDSTPYFQLSVPAYGNNTIFVANSHGELYAINASTGSNRWSPVTVCDGQLNTPVVYYKSGDETQGRIFFGDWNGPKKYYCYREDGTECWNRTSTSGGGYYWAGAAVIGDYLVYGDDAGNLTSVYWCNGTTADEINVSEVFGVDVREIRSSVTWNDNYGRIYFASKGGYCYAIGFDKSTGEFNTTNKWRHYIGYSTSTPAVYDGRVYVGQGGFGNVGKLYCLDESDGSEIWSFTPNGGVQSSPVISTANGTLYFTTNCEDGRVYCLYLNGTEAWHFENYENGTSGGYTLQGVALSDGMVFFGNDGGYLYAIMEKPGAPSKPDLTLTAIECATIYNGTYNIIHATVRNAGDRSAGQFSVSLGVNGNIVENRTVNELGAGEATDVKFLWIPNATGTYILNVTADIDNTVDEWDETNNSISKSVTVQEIPSESDLVVREVYSGDLLNGTENEVFAVIENRGADAAGFNVSLSVDGAAVDKVFVPMLRFRDSQLVTFEWTPGSTGAVTLNVSIENGGGFKTQTVNVALPTTVTVSSGGSIQSEVNSASNNTIILVEPGVYEEQVIIPASKSGIRLIANGSNVVIASDTGDVVTIEGANIYVRGFDIMSGWDGSVYPNFPGAGINISSDWNVIENNYIYNTSCGIKLYGSHNIVRCNEIGNSTAGRACLNLMAIAGDCNMVRKNRFDGDTGYGFVLGGVFTSTGIHETEASNNTIRDNNFTVKSAGSWSAGAVKFGGDPNLVFNNVINDMDASKIVPGRLNWYFVDRVGVENPKCGNIVHGPYYGGNYWLNYSGSDSDNDLLGDTLLPHLGYDKHPLIKAKCGDVDCSGSIAYVDVFKLKKHYKTQGAYQLASEWAGDVDCSGSIVYVDVFKLKKHYSDPSYALHCCTCTGCEG